MKVLQTLRVGIIIKNKLNDMKLIKGKIYKVKVIQGYIRAVYMGVMNGEMTICDVNVKGGRLYCITKEDIDNGDLIEELTIFEVENKEDYNLK